MHRVPRARAPVEVKSAGLFGTLHHRRTAQLNGYDDALLAGTDGAVSEGSTWSIGFFDGDQVIWPAAKALPGVTMCPSSSPGEAGPTRGR